MIVVKLKNITKSFPGNIANDNISIDVEEKTIHCLLGENGSGKTTLMNILFGLYQKDSGDIYINDQLVQINNPADAEKLGIGMVHQHFMLLNQFTVWENIVLGSEPGKIVIDKEKAKKDVQAIIHKYNFNLDINQKVINLSVGMKQRIEIVKLLYRSAEIIIFDEPTAVLSPQEVTELFTIFKQLISKGCTIIFITHKLNEIFAISDYVSVLRRGKLVATTRTDNITSTELSELMVGNQIIDVVNNTNPKLGDVVLEVDKVKLFENQPEAIHLMVQKGEIVGIAGIDGNGQMELEEMIVGVRKFQEGSIYLCNHDVSKLSVKKRKELGLGYIPSDRAKSGVLLKASVKENFLLGYQDSKKYQYYGFINFKTLENESEQLVEEYDIRLSTIEQTFGGLSGGNQQKVVLAREVSKNIQLLLAAQPIRGLDIGATEYIHKILLNLRDEGKGILLISAELSELLSMCDRIIVLHKGKITGEFNRDNFDENAIGLAMLGNMSDEVNKK